MPAHVPQQSRHSQQHRESGSQQRNSIDGTRSTRGSNSVGDAFRFALDYESDAARYYSRKRVPAAFAHMPAAVLRSVHAQCRGDWRRVTIDASGLLVHNRVMWQRTPDED